MKSNKATCPDDLSPRFLKEIAERVHSTTRMLHTYTEPFVANVPECAGLLLFLAYINDLPSKVNTKARLFADDYLLYHHIKTDEDAESLQDDFNKLNGLGSRLADALKP